MGKVIYMKKLGEKIKYPSLYDEFELGDRVARYYKDKMGKNKEYRGIILSIEPKFIEIYWDTIDGKYRPDNMDVAFTTCPVKEIFNGNNHYSPIKKY